MSKAVAGRLDKIENEIKHLIKIQNRTKPTKHKHFVQDYISYLLTNGNEQGSQHNNSVNPHQLGPHNYEAASNSSSLKSPTIRASLDAASEKKLYQVFKVKDKGDDSLEVSFSGKGRFRPCKSQVEECSEHAVCDINCFILKIQKLQKILKNEKETSKSLRFEILRLEQTINQLRLNKEETHKISNEWKEKYMSLKNCKCSTKLYNEVVKDKENLARALQEDRYKLVQATEELKRCKRLLHNKRLANESTKELMKNLGEKNETIANLEKKLEKSERYNKELNEQCNQLNNSLNILTENLRSLQNTNHELARDMIVKCNCFKAATSKAELKIRGYKKMKLELESLKETCNNQSRTCQEKDDMNKCLMVQVTALTNELNSVKGRGSSFENSVDVLENKLNNLKSDYMELEGFSRSNLEKLGSEKGALLKKIAELSYKLEAEENHWMEKYNNLQNDFAFFKNSMKNREDMAKIEKDELSAVIEEMTRILKEQKQKISNLIQSNLRFEEKIKMQNFSLDDKEEQLKAAKQEIQAIKVHHSDLEERCKQLHSSCAKSRVGELEEAVSTLRKMIKAEQEKISIKDKMLEDQNETIRSLKWSASKTENDVQELSLQTQKCQKEKNEISSQFLAIKHENQSIIHKNNELGNNVAMQNNLIENIEKKLALKEAEWSLQLRVLEKEKETAQRAAKFATDNLLQTTQDFEKHIKVQNQTCSALALLLKKKDDKLKAVIAQMSSLTLDQDACLQTLNFSSQRSHLSSNHSTFSYSDEST